MRLRWWVLLSICVSFCSLFLLNLVRTTIWPEPTLIIAIPQLLFLFLMFIGLSTGAVPLTAYINHRFARPGWTKRDRSRLLRQGAWVGCLGVLFAYLQLIRALNWTIAAVMGCVFILIEIFFLTRE